LLYQNKKTMAGVFRVQSDAEYRAKLSDLMNIKSFLSREIQETIRLERSINSQRLTIGPIAGRFKFCSDRLNAIEEELDGIRSDLMILRDNKIRVDSIILYLKRNGREGNDDLEQELYLKKATLEDESLGELEGQEQALVVERERILNDHAYRSAKRDAEAGELMEGPLLEKLEYLVSRRQKFARRSNQISALINNVRDERSKQPKRKYAKKQGHYSEAQVTAQAQRSAVTTRIKK
jgi:hypothetical protein